MLFHQLSFLYFFLFFNIIFYIYNELLFFLLLEIYFSETTIFIFIFISIFIINFIIWDDKIELGLKSELENLEIINLDFYYSLIVLNSNDFVFFFNFIKIEIKKFFIFLINFKHAVNIFCNKMFFKKKIKNFFLVWRPLFKKWSYFGYYRSNQSKWIK